MRRRYHRLVRFGLVGLAATAVAAASADTVPPDDPVWNGVPHCTVPQVKRLPLAKAKTRLTGARCGVGFIFKQRSSVKKGKVIYSLPKAGSIMAPQTAIDLYVSRGKS